VPEDTLVIPDMMVVCGYFEYFSVTLEKLKKFSLLSTLNPDFGHFLGGGLEIFLQNLRNIGFST